MMKEDHAIRERVVCSLSLIEREVLITKTLAKLRSRSIILLVNWVGVDSSRTFALVHTTKQAKI
jgi:hypothetical protein